MKCLFKDHNVTLENCDTTVMEALCAAASVWKRYGVRYLTIASASEPAHPDTSPHFLGYAVNLLSRSLPNVFAMADDLRQLLDDDFDVLVNADHIHIEYNPRKP